MTDLRKLSNHPLLMRYHYQIDDIKDMAKHLKNDPDYKEKNKAHIVEDLLHMSDFEIHEMTKQFSVIAVLLYSVGIYFNYIFFRL